MTFSERLKALTPTPRDTVVFLVMVLVSVVLGEGADKLLSKDGADGLLRVQAQAYCAVSAFKPQGLATMYADMLMRPRAKAPPLTAAAPVDRQVFTPLTSVRPDPTPAQAKAAEALMAPETSSSALSPAARAAAEAELHPGGSASSSVLPSAPTARPTPPPPAVEAARPASTPNAPTAFTVAPLHLTPQDQAMIASGALDIKPVQAPPAGVADCPEAGRQRLTALDVGEGMRSVRALSPPPPPGGLVVIPPSPHVEVMDIPFTFGSLVWRLLTTGPAVQRVVFLLQLLLGFSLTSLCVGLVAGDGFAAQPALMKAIVFSLGVVALGSLGAWLVQAGMQVGLLVFGRLVRFALLASGFHTLAFGGYFFSVKAAELRGHHLMEHQVEHGVERVAEWLQRLFGR